MARMPCSLGPASPSSLRCSPARTAPDIRLSCQRLVVPPGGRVLATLLSAARFKPSLLHFTDVFTSPRHAAAGPHAVTLLAVLAVVRPPDPVRHRLLHRALLSWSCFASLRCRVVVRKVLHVLPRVVDLVVDPHSGEAPAVPNDFAICVCEEGKRGPRIARLVLGKTLEPEFRHRLCEYRVGSVLVRKMIIMRSEGGGVGATTRRCGGVIPKATD